MFSNPKVGMGLSIVSVLILLAVASTITTACSKSSVQEMTLQIELIKSEQEYNQSMLYLVDGILEWEKVADDFSMHADWEARKNRADARSTELSVSISALQNQLDKCNQEGD